MNSIASGLIKNFSSLSLDRKDEIMKKFIDLAAKSVDYISYYFNARSLKNLNQESNSENFKFKLNSYPMENTTPRIALGQRLLVMLQFEPDISKKLQFLETMKFLHLQKNQTRDEKIEGHHIIDHMESIIKYPENYKINGEIKTIGMNTAKAMVMLDCLKNSSIDFYHQSMSDSADLKNKYNEIIKRFQSALSDEDILEKNNLIHQMKVISLDKNNSQFDQKNVISAINYMQDRLLFQPYMQMILENESENDKSKLTEGNHITIKFSPELYERIRVSLLTPIDKQNYAQRTESFELHKEISALRAQRSHPIENSVVNLQTHHRPRD